MKFIIFLSFTIVSMHSKAQSTDWQRSQHWKMYKAGSSKGLGLSKEQLLQLPSLTMNDDSVHLFLKDVQVLAKDKNYVWMGAYYATCEIDSVLCKIDISVYGGFFYNETTRRYYELPKYMRTDWRNWLGTIKEGFAQPMITD